MQLNIKTNDIIKINNLTSKIVSIDPEQPSKVTTIIIEYLEGPIVGQRRTLEVFTSN
jgi:hypothetical protein